MKTDDLLQLNNDVLQNILDAPMVRLPKILALNIKGLIMANKDKLSERQTTAEASKSIDTKQLIIADVSQQRELLIAFREWINEDEEMCLYIPEKHIDRFIEGNL